MSISFTPIHRPSSSMPVFLLIFSGEISADEFDGWLSMMSELLDRQHMFALIYQSQKGLILPNNYRQAEAVWYKANKEKFFVYCQGLVRIADDENQRQELDSAAYHKAWQVPYTVTLSLDEAKNWLTAKIGAVL